MGYANVINNELMDDDELALAKQPFARRIASRFSDQVTWLESQIGDVPQGWNRIFKMAIRSLRAVACSRRDGIEFSEPVCVRGVLTVAVYYAISDKVASAILFKLSKRSECTCQHCGRAYAVRFRPCSQKTLCAKCHVQGSLKDMVTKWVPDDGSHTVQVRQPIIEFDSLPLNIQFLIPQQRIKFLVQASTFSQIKYLVPEDLQVHAAKLQEIKRLLERIECD